MREEIKNKMYEHVEQILAKPSISNEEYAFLKEKLAEFPTKDNSGFGNSWLLLLMMFIIMGGQKDEL